MTNDEADRLLHGFAEWTNLEPSWRALALVGSWARGAARDDSDLDLLVLTDRLESWTASDTWLRTIVTALGYRGAIAGLEVYGVAKSWRVWLGPRVELELALAPLSWADISPIDSGSCRVVSDGMVAVVDKDGLLRSIQDAVLARR